MAQVLKRKRKGSGRTRRRGNVGSGKPTVFATNKWDTGDTMHRVIWAKNGNLNTAEQRGNVKRFRHWGIAKGFAALKARQIGATKRKKIDSDHASFWA